MNYKFQHILIPFIMMMILLWITSREKYYLQSTIDGYLDINSKLTDSVSNLQLDVISLLNENKAWKELYLSLPLGSPLDTIIVTSNYGWRLNPKTEIKEHHDGVDLLAGPWDNVYATGNGIVVRSNWYKG